MIGVSIYDEFRKASSDINMSDAPVQEAATIAVGLRQLIDTITAARSVCLQYRQCHFIDTADLFLDKQGQPQGKLYQFDGLHLSREGYQLWTGRIKPLLL